MLTSSSPQKISGKGFHFALVAADYNARYADALLKACQSHLEQAGAKCVVAHVPGSFEIPVVAAHFATWDGPPINAVICIGVIFQGETKHADHIALSVSDSLAQLQIQHNVPIIHAVLSFTNEDQARVRCLEAEHNRGTEAAQVALAMAQLMHKLRNE